MKRVYNKSLFSPWKSWRLFIHDLLHGAALSKWGHYFLLPLHLAFFPRFNKGQNQPSWQTLFVTMWKVGRNCLSLKEHLRHNPNCWKENISLLKPWRIGSPIYLSCVTYICLFITKRYTIVNISFFMCHNCLAVLFRAMDLLFH